MRDAASSVRAAAVAPEALVESVSDDHETEMTYDHGRAPWIVIIVWIVAIIGFAIYMGVYCFADLALWGRP